MSLRTATPQAAGISRQAVAGELAKNQEIEGVKLRTLIGD